MLVAGCQQVVRPTAYEQHKTTMMEKFTIFEITEIRPKFRFFAASGLGIWTGMGYHL